MATHIRSSVQTGLVFGAIIIFLVMTGFAETLGTSLGALFASAEAPPVAGTILLLVLLGLWTGGRAARPGDHDTWPRALLAGLLAGLSAGVLAGALGYLLGGQIDAGVNLRKYLVALSPDAVGLYLLGRGTTNGALSILGLLTVASLAGSILARGIFRGPVREAIDQFFTGIRQAVSQAAPVRAAQRHPASRIVAYVLLLAVVLWLPTRLSQAWDYNMGTILIYVLMGLGLNIVVGFAGLLDLGYVAFFAVGAYTVALLTAPGPHGLLWNFWVVVPLAVLLAATAGILLGIPVLRLRGDYLAIVTLGFGEIIRILAGSDALTWFSGGPMGVVDIPQPLLFGRVLGFEEFVYLLLIGVLLVIFITDRLQHSRVGRAWVAMREDETVAQAVGINTLQAKLLAFGIGAAFAGLGGALFASRNQFTNPQDHTLIVSINVLAVVIVGGMGSIPGVILGAFVLKGVPEILREFENFRIIIFAALLVIMMILRPEGILPSQRRRLEIHAAEESPPDAEEEPSAAQGEVLA